VFPVDGDVFMNEKEVGGCKREAMQSKQLKV